MITAPSADFKHLEDLVSLPILAPALSEPFSRIFGAKHADSLGIGFGSSRLSDPRDPPRFKILYLTEDSATAFAGVVLCDRRTGFAGRHLLSETEIDRWQVALISTTSALNLLDLARPNVVKHGIDADVLQIWSHKESQRLSLVLHEHSSAIDGILFDSRITKKRCIGLSERAISKLAADTQYPSPSDSIRTIRGVGRDEP